MGWQQFDKIKHKWKPRTYDPSRYQYIYSNFAKYNISSSCEETILDVSIDSKKTFKSHVENLYRKAGNKLHAPYKKFKFMTTKQKG